MVGAMDISMELKKFMETELMQGNASLKMQESQTLSLLMPTKRLGNEFNDHDKTIQKLTPDDIPEDIWALLNEIEDDYPPKDSWGKPNDKESVVCSVSTTITTSESTGLKLVETETPQIALGLNGNKLHQDAGVCTFSLRETAQCTDMDDLHLSLSDLPTPSVFLPSANDFKNSPIHFPNFDLPLDINTPDVDVGILMSNSADLFVPSVLDLIEEHNVIDEEKIAAIQDQLVKDIPPAEDAKELSKSIPEVPTLPPSNFLTLTIGNSEQVLVGNGARLQLKRRASSGLTCIQENNSLDSTSGSAPTIIITVVDSSNGNCQLNVANADSKDTSVHDVEPYSSAKKMCMTNAREDEMRRKNNEASRRSRLSRRTKEKDMVKLAEKLEQNNKKLRIKVEHLTKLRETVKTQLINLLKSK